MCDPGVGFDPFPNIPTAELIHHARPAAAELLRVRGDTGPRARYGLGSVTGPAR